MNTIHMPKVIVCSKWDSKRETDKPRERERERERERDLRRRVLDGSDTELC